jgi:transposase
VATPVPVIARLVSTSEDRVREMIHRFNELGVRSLDPQWAGGRPRRITTDVERLVKGGTARSLRSSFGARSIPEGSTA